jgi:hypothetical protein
MAPQALTNRVCLSAVPCNTDVVAERVRKQGQLTLHSIGEISRNQRIADNDAAYVTAGHAGEASRRQHGFRSQPHRPRRFLQFGGCLPAGESAVNVVLRCVERGRLILTVPGFSSFSRKRAASPGTGHIRMPASRACDGSTNGAWALAGDPPVPASPTVRR